MQRRYRKQLYLFFGLRGRKYARYDDMNGAIFNRR